eukprot:362927-Chlamydomonas_euryale.AAC.12
MPLTAEAPVSCLSPGASKPVAGSLHGRGLLLYAWSPNLTARTPNRNGIKHPQNGWPRCGGDAAAALMPRRAQAVD